MLLQISLIAGLLWFFYLLNDFIRNRSVCPRHKTPYKKVGYEERDLCVECFDENKEGRAKAAERFFSNKSKALLALKGLLPIRKSVDGILPRPMFPIPLCSYRSHDDIGTDRHEPYKIQVKGEKPKRKTTKKK